MTTPNETPVTLSNPRLDARIADYPLGGDRRGECHFWVETHPKRGQRVLRQTTGKPKAGTYQAAVVIVDGSDGRTYLLALTSAVGGHIKVSRSDFMDARIIPGRYGRLEAAAFPGDEAYAGLAALISQAQTAVTA